MVSYCFHPLYTTEINFEILCWPHFEFFYFFAKISKHKNAYISKTRLDRADYTDFGGHHSIRLESEHFFNTFALTSISFSGRFVFAVQKHYIFFANDPLVYFCCVQVTL